MVPKISSPNRTEIMDIMLSLNQANVSPHLTGLHWHDSVLLLQVHHHFVFQLT